MLAHMWFTLAARKDNSDAIHNRDAVAKQLKAEQLALSQQWVAQWIEKNNIDSILLVTSAYHMHRAKLEFHRKIKNVAITSYPVVTDEETWRTEKFWRLTFEEYNKTLLVWLNLGSQR